MLLYRVDLSLWRISNRVHVGFCQLSKAFDVISLLVLEILLAWSLVILEDNFDSYLLCYDSCNLFSLSISTL